MNSDQFSEFKDFVTITVGQSEQRLEQRIETGLGGLVRRIDNLATELEDFRTEMRDFRTEVGGFRTEMRDFRHETSENFKAVAKVIDRHNDDIDGLDKRVTKLESNLA